VERVVKGQQAETTLQFSVFRLVLATGERLPSLADQQTWLLTHVTTRWVMSYWAQSSILTHNLHLLSLLYTWARTNEGSGLSTHLTRDNTLIPGQIAAFVSTMRLLEAFMNTTVYALKLVQNASDIFSPLITEASQQESIQSPRRIKQALEVMQTQETIRNGKIAQAWIQHCKDIFAGGKAALAIDDDPMIHGGAAIRPFKTTSVNFRLGNWTQTM
jgi:hypothetical protein